MHISHQGDLRGKYTSARFLAGDDFAAVYVKSFSLQLKFESFCNCEGNNIIALAFSDCILQTASVI